MNERRASDVDRPRPTRPSWPPPERLAVIIEAIRRGIERYREEFEARDREREDGDE